MNDISRQDKTGLDKLNDALTEADKSLKEAFDFILAGMPEPESVRNVSSKDAVQLIYGMERLQKYMGSFEHLIEESGESAQEQQTGFAEVLCGARELIRNLILDIEYLQRKK